MTTAANASLELLADVRVIDFTRALSSLCCTVMSADLGADVIQVETSLRGDDSRHSGPPYVGEDLHREAALPLIDEGTVEIQKMIIGRFTSKD